jgi:hypothetical protein
MASWEWGWGCHLLNRGVLVLLSSKVRPAIVSMSPRMQAWGTPSRQLSTTGDLTRQLNTGTLGIGVESHRALTDRGLGILIEGSPSGEMHHAVEREI